MGVFQDILVWCIGKLITRIYICFIVTGTSYTKELIKLKYPTDKIVSVSYVNKRPYLCKRKDVGSKELSDMNFNKDDKRRIIRDISKKDPRFSPSIKRNDKRWFYQRCKKKRPKY